MIAQHFVSDTFAHLKAVAPKATPFEGLSTAAKTAAFIKAAAKRYYDREGKVG